MDSAPVSVGVLHPIFPTKNEALGAGSAVDFPADCPPWTRLN